MPSELNPAQQAAVEYCDGPSLVIAGAGSGKTRVLTHKIAHLLQHGYQPWQILALTFTNKAAREMKERIGRQVGQAQAAQLWMGTFHSIFARILRVEAPSIGFTPQFTIYDADDAKSLLHNIVRQMQLDDKQYKASALAARISHAKNCLSLPVDRPRDGSLPALPDIARRYQERLRQANAMDFDDLLVHTFTLLRDHPDVLAKYQERFRFLLVDEYQDTNFVQHQIVRLLAARHQHLCVVGDDAQSIYSFRGANLDNILHFQQQFPSARLFKLEQNYRSTQHIVAAANSLIHHNTQQIPKDVFSQNDLGAPVLVTPTYSDTDEAQSVARTIVRYQREGHTPLSQIAILYRNNAQSRPLEEALNAHRLPYRLYGGTSFYERKEIKDVVAYLRLAVNPLDEEALRRIINYPARGIGQTTLQRILAASAAHGLSPWHVLSRPDLSGVSHATQQRLDAFRLMMLDFQSQAPQADALSLLRHILQQSGIQADVMRGTEPDDLSKQQNLQELINAVSAFVDEQTEQGQSPLLVHYLQQVSLLSGVDQDPSDAAEKLTLMTIHSAKGLEFDIVFVVGLEDSILPGDSEQRTPRAVEEERRLLYVAMTRARHRLHLSYARCRYIYGRMEFGRPSRFLDELDPSHLQYQGRAPERTRRPSPANLSAPPLPAAAPRRLVPVPPSSPVAPAAQTDATQLSPGTRVVHPRFGPGEVQSVEGRGIDAKATIRFQNAGVKVLLLRFARLQVEG